jgi:hypothetical protein
MYIETMPSGKRAIYRGGYFPNGKSKPTHVHEECCRPFGIAAAEKMQALRPNDHPLESPAICQWCGKEIV